MKKVKVQKPEPVEKEYFIDFYFNGRYDACVRKGKSRSDVKSKFMLEFKGARVISIITWNAQINK